MLEEDFALLSMGSLRCRSWMVWRSCEWEICNVITGRWFTTWNKSARRNEGETTMLNFSISSLSLLSFAFGNPKCLIKVFLIGPSNPNYHQRHFTTFFSQRYIWYDNRTLSLNPNSTTLSFQSQNELFCQEWIFFPVCSVVVSGCNIDIIRILSHILFSSWLDEHSITNQTFECSDK